MTKQTILHSQHQALGALLVDFAGWHMPLHYGSQLNEHHIVRKDAGMFDVSHMQVVDIVGAEAQAFLRKLLANDIARLKQPGKALYSCMLNEQAGVIDDLIVYYLRDEHYRMVVNAGTAEKDIAWMQQQAQAFKVNIKPQPHFAIIAVQGPEAIAKAQRVFSEKQCQAVQSLKPFSAAIIDEWMIARTGYTGEKGYEIILPQDQALALWQALLAVEVKPCGLGARDTLRLEAGYNLYGQDMDENITPYQANLAWTVSLTDPERQFIGRKALERQPVDAHLVGIVLSQRGVLRHGQKVIVDGVGEGFVTSGTFSPTLQQGIAMARLPVGYGEECAVDIRGKALPARIIKMPFIKSGEKVA